MLAPVAQANPQYLYKGCSAAPETSARAHFQSQTIGQQVLSNETPDVV